MSSASYFITPQQLWSRIGTADAPMIPDCRRRASYDAGQDHGLLGRGFVVYDALFAWARNAADERHNWPAKTVEKAA
jgi:hypothetical protein